MKERCRFGLHCNQENPIQLHLPKVRTYCCVKCAAKEEGMTQKLVREQASTSLVYGTPGEDSIHWVKERTVEAHERQCPF